MFIVANNTQDLAGTLAKIEQKARIGFGDVQRLRREYLAAGITSRAEAERLIALDRRAGRSDPAWSGWLVASIVDFVVWSERPTGVVTEDDARWLAGLLAESQGRPASTTSRAILREIAEEAQAFENDALAILAKASESRARRRPVAARNELPAAA